MKKYLTTIILFALCATAGAQSTVSVQGVGDDGKRRIVATDNNGVLKTTATVTGGGDASAANQTATQANPGSDSTKAQAVQGVTGGKAVAVKPTGTANYANGQVTTSTTAGTLVAARATRRSVTVVNTDLAITVYIGAATVTAANGLPLKAGQSVPIDTVALIQVIAASGTPVVAYMETYD